MSNMLTPRQKEILNYIKNCIKKNDYSPSLEEIGKHFKLSVSTVHQHIEALKDKGFINKTDNHARSIEVFSSELMVQVPFFGTIAAGYPIEVMEEKETIAVPKSKLPANGNYYALKVQGNSMIDENINDGDVLLIKSQQTANNGDRVVALINNSEATLKRYYKEKNQIRLQPANRDFNPIIIKKETNLKIQGILFEVINTLPKNNLIINKEISNKRSLERKIRVNELTEDPNSDNIFYSNEYKLNSIYNLDCLELTKQIKNDSIDLVFADPPYNLSGSNFKMKFTKSGGTDLNTNKGKWDRYTDTEFEDFTEKWLTECYRILKKNGSIWVAGTYHNIYLVGYLMKKIGFDILNEVLWHKSDATPNLSCTRFVADHENFIWARKGKGNIFNYSEMKMMNGGKQMRSIWTKGKTTGGKKIHPTQKPEWLLERVILSTSNPNNIIFDPFIGSGTTAVVAKKFNRSYLGAELDRDYFNKSIKRINETFVCKNII